MTSPLRLVIDTGRTLAPVGRDLGWLSTVAGPVGA